MSNSRRVIKRYSNRKLYDMTQSRYVTLQEVGVMIRAGEEVQIVDHKTGEDKTEVALAQILSEDLRAAPHSVPLAALRGLIETRGGQLLSQLRDSPLGRLLPRTPAPQGPDSSAAAPPLQGAVGNAPSVEAFQALQTAVEDLTKRVASLEATLHVPRIALHTTPSQDAESRDRPLIATSTR